jgi:hypothetical protein
MPLVLASLVEDLTFIPMPIPDRKPAPDFEPDYDIADVEFDDTPLVSDEVVTDAEYEEAADPDYDDTVQAEYEAEIIDPEYEEVAEMEKQAEPEPAVVMAARSDFAFDVGRAVLPLAQQQPCPVVWRGHLRERHPITGLVQRVPVYRLADGYWDCYREEELRVA